MARSSTAAYLSPLSLPPRAYAGLRSSLQYHQGKIKFRNEERQRERGASVTNAAIARYAVVRETLLSACRFPLQDVFVCIFSSDRATQRRFLIFIFDVVFLIFYPQNFCHNHDCSE
jgi:hypothetical protein